MESQSTNANVGSTLLDQPTGCPLRQAPAGLIPFCADMAGKPSFQFYPGDWMKDPALRGCEPATRGIWLDLLCAMWNGDTGWDISGTLRGHARVCGCTEDEMRAAIDELEQRNVAEITRHDNGTVTVGSRRMRRDMELRDKEADKKRSQRSSMSPTMSPSCPDHVPELSPHSSIEDEDEEEEVKEEVEKETRAGFEKAWTAYGHKVDRKNAERAWRAMSKTNRAKALEAIPAYVGRTDPQGSGGLTIRAYMATWLRAERWNDEAPAAVAHTNGHAKRPCTNCGGDLGPDHASHQGKPYCGTCYDRAPWLTRTLQAA